MDIERGKEYIELMVVVSSYCFIVKSWKGVQIILLFTPWYYPLFFGHFHFVLLPSPFCLLS